MLLIAVVGEGFDGDAATRVEQPDDLQVSGIHQFHQVFHDDVDTILMEVAMVAEAEKVQFEALALNHAHAGDVVDDDVAKVRLARFGTQRRELRAIEGYNIFVLRMFVLKSLQNIRRVVVTVMCVLVAQQGDAVQFLLVS